LPERSGQVFSQIVAVITLVLVVGMAIASIHYGGSAWWSRGGNLSTIAREIAASAPAAAPAEESPCPWLILGGENGLIVIFLAVRLRRRIGALGSPSGA
jgi:hypothetical protein